MASLRQSGLACGSIYLFTKDLRLLCLFVSGLPKSPSIYPISKPLGTTPLSKILTDVSPLDKTTILLPFSVPLAWPQDCSGIISYFMVKIKETIT